MKNYKGEWVFRWCVRCHKNIFYNVVHPNKKSAKFACRRLGKDYFYVFAEVPKYELY